MKVPLIDQLLLFTPPIAEIVWVKKREGNCGLWVLNENFLKNIYPE